MSDYVAKIEIEEILEVESGVSASGEWEKVSFIGTEVEGDYPKTIGFEIFGVERVEKFQKYNNVGDIVNVHFNISSREYNGKIYTTASAWRVTSEDYGNAAPEPDGFEDEDEDPFA